jgi:clan AA aspartic protease
MSDDWIRQQEVLIQECLDGWSWEQVVSSWLSRISESPVSLEPLFTRIEIHDPAAPVGREIECIVDTGFSGSLSLPPTLVAELGLPFRRRGRALLADGSETFFDIHEASVIWDGRPRLVPTDAADSDPLIGMTLLEGYELTVQAVDDGHVSIGALASP